MRLKKMARCTRNSLHRLLFGTANPADLHGRLVVAQDPDTLNVGIYVPFAIGDIDMPKIECSFALTVYVGDEQKQEFTIDFAVGALAKLNEQKDE